MTVKRKKAKKIRARAGWAEALGLPLRRRKGKLLDGAVRYEMAVQASYLGNVVHARARMKSTGVVVGTRRCQLEGCGHTRLGVRWSKTRLTWPCVGAMEVLSTRDGMRHWKIL